MRWKSVFKQGSAISSGWILVMLASCSEQNISGPVNVRLIQPTAQHCGYTIAPATLVTVENLNELKGRIGRTAVNDELLIDQNPVNGQDVITSEVLTSGRGFNPVQVDFTKSGDVYVPLDFSTLFAASLYYDMEQGYLLFSGLDPVNGDLAKIVPNFSETTIVHGARRIFKGQKEEAADNAEYFPTFPNLEATEPIKNYFFSFPTKMIEDLPLGLNLGIMVHEYTHMVFQYLFRVPKNKSGSKFATTTALRTELSLNEGLADYFGFLVAKDPGYFHCTNPTANRDLSEAKQFTAQFKDSIADEQRRFDHHGGGAIWAAIQYQIGQAIGDHAANGASLIRLMSKLLNCVGGGEGAKLDFDFAKVVQCHLSAMGETRSDYTSIAQSVYNKYLGPYGGNGGN